MSKAIAKDLKTQGSGKKQSSQVAKSSTSDKMANRNGATKTSASTLRDLNKAYAEARTKKEKDEARKALTLATFNATYESHNKKRH